MLLKNKLLDTKPRICFFIQSALGAAVTYLTSGVFLSGLALLMGAGDVLVSYLSVVVNICGVLILAFAAFLERFRSRKRLTIALTVLSRLAALFIVLVPALVPQRMRLAVFVPMVVAAFTLQAQTTVVLNQWMMAFMDESKSGRYISLRQTAALAVTVASSIICGRWMDAMQGEYVAFVILFSAAAGIGVLEVVLLARTPDSAPYQPGGAGCRFQEIAMLPVKDRKFMGFIIYVFTFYLLLYISDSFTMVFMMKYLRLPYLTVTALYMIISLPQVLFLGMWGKISDKRGHGFVLRASVGLFIGETLFMSFASSQSCLIFIPIAFLISSLANAGFVVSVFNRRYELMPQENRIVYDNFYTAAIGLGFVLGPMTGGLLKGVLEAVPAAQGVMEFASIRILYLVSAAGILLLQGVTHWTRVKEGGCIHAGA